MMTQINGKLKKWLNIKMLITPINGKLKRLPQKEAVDNYNTDDTN